MQHPRRKLKSSSKKRSWEVHGALEHQRILFCFVLLNNNLVVVAICLQLFRLLMLWEEVLLLQ